MFLKINKQMNIKEFIEKYKIIIVLVAMIIILAFVKSYFGKKINENNIVVSPTPTQNIKKSTNNEKNKSDNLNNSTDLTRQENLIEEEVVLSSSETNKKYEELVEKSRTYQTEEEYSTWFETLSFEDQQLLEGYSVVQVSQLTDELPYEGETFIIKSVVSNHIVSVKAKIDDLEKAEIDVRNWLSSKGMNFDNLVISWE